MTEEAHEHDHSHPHAFGTNDVRDVTPILNVSNLTDSFAWFGKLGWVKMFDWSAPGGEPSFGSVGCGERVIYICRDGQGGRGGDNGVWLTIWVDDVDAVNARCSAEGLDVTHPPTDEPWGVREMHVRHPDGHVFRISRGIEHG